jgi:alpha-beta hydrolase superfamily lysophospholipase
MSTPGPRMPSTEFQFTSTDGVRVACVRWEARAPVRGIVQIVHGMGEHIGRYVGLIDILLGAGVTVYGNDRDEVRTRVLEQRKVDSAAR